MEVTPDGPIEIVAFSPQDPDNPKNWSKNFKRLTIAMLCTLMFVCVLGSTFYAPAEPQMRAKYGISPSVASLGLSLYVLGFAFGPLLCPLGEMYGRRICYLVAWPLFVASLALSAWVDNAIVIILFRFFSGATAAVPLSNGSAAAADLYGDLQAKALASSYLSFSAFFAPVLAPIVGYFVSTRFPHELWVLRLELFIAIAAYPVVLLLPETHGPTILAVRAKRLRKMGHHRALAPHELAQRTKGQLLRINLVRPSVMLVKEPIVIGASVWMALTYGILYFSFEAYPVIFLKQHGIPAKFGGLMFIPVGLGMLISVFSYVPVVKYFQRLRLPDWMGDANDSSSPESMLKLAFLACGCLTVSSFLLAWTSGPETHWLVPGLTGILFGYANLTIFYTFVTYLTHTYTLYTASAMAANTFARSFIVAIFPVVAHKILDGLGTKWGITVFGFLSLGLMPIPVIFLRHGKHLRATSPLAQEALALVGKLEKPEGDMPKAETPDAVQELEKN